MHSWTPGQEICGHPHQVCIGLVRFHRRLEGKEQNGDRKHSEVQFIADWRAKSKMASNDRKQKHKHVGCECARCSRREA